MREFKVRRRWLPWRRKVRELPDGPDWAGDLGDDPISMILAPIVLILLIPFFVVAFLLLLELLLLLALLPLFVGIRLLLPVPWTIEVFSRPKGHRLFGWHLEREVQVSGWKASRATMRELP